MSDFNGDDLLKVFKELDVHLLNLNSNVIKGWFDTDDKNMKNLLNWMCTSLSGQNYVSPLETDEYKKLALTVPRETLEAEKKSLETKYSGIFDIESNALEIEFLQDEISLLQEDEENLDGIIRINQVLERNLLKELDKKASQEIRSSLQLKSAQEKCLAYGETLDELNGKIHEGLLKYGKNLQDFEFNPIPNFLNNMDVKLYQDKVEDITSMLMPFLEEQPVSMCTTASEATFLDVTNVNEAVAHDLLNMRHRILHSHRNFLSTKIEVEKWKELKNYLDNGTVESLLNSTDRLCSPEDVKSKEKLKQMMSAMLDKIAADFADKQISLTQLKYVEKELETFQAKLNSLTNIEDVLKQLVSHYLVLSLLYIEEKKDINGSEEFFRKVSHYISTELGNCRTRTAKMNDIIDEYSRHSPEQSFPLIRSIIRMFGSKEDETFSIARAFEIVCDFKKELQMLENRLFSSSFDEYKSAVPELKSGINILQQFLVSGPTHRVVLVPSELRLVVGAVEEILKEQLASVKSALEISASMKKNSDKWKMYRRQLWMYFYAEPHRLKFVLHQIQEECSKKSKTNKD